MKTFIQKLCKLIDVKSIITIYLTVIFGYLSAKGQVSIEQFLTVYTVIIAFYFGTQYQKNSTNKDVVQSKGKYEKTDEELG